MLSYHVLEREGPESQNIIINPVFRETYTVLISFANDLKKTIQTGERCKWRLEKKGQKETGNESILYCEECYKRNLSLLLEPVCRLM